MSVLTEINEFLESIKGKSAADLHVLMADLDPESTLIEDADLAQAVVGYMQTSFIKGELPSFVNALTRAEKLKEEHGYLFSTPATAAFVVAAPAAVSTPAADATAPIKIRKSDQAQALFDSLEDKSKPNVIAVFQSQLGISAAAAQTYYYNCGGSRTNRAADGARISPTGPKRADDAGPTKAERARALYQAATDKSRGVIIALFEDQLAMSKAGATTYYYTVVNEMKKAAAKVTAPVVEAVAVTPADVVAEAVAMATEAVVAEAGATTPQDELEDEFAVDSSITQAVEPEVVGD